MIKCTIDNEKYYCEQCVKLVDENSYHVISQYFHCFDYLNVNNSYPWWLKKNLSLRLAGTVHPVPNNIADQLDQVNELDSGHTGHNKLQ